MKMYVASSWRNNRQQSVVQYLESSGHEVYDFRHPSEDDNRFHWSEIDKAWKLWTPQNFIDGLKHPLAEAGFETDWDAMQWADACVLVMPCGRSAHLEAGYFVGAGKKLVILVDDGEPELMYKMADKVCTNMAEIQGFFRK